MGLRTPYTCAQFASFRACYTWKGRTLAPSVRAVLRRRMTPRSREMRCCAARSSRTKSMVVRQCARARVRARAHVPCTACVRSALHRVRGAGRGRIALKMRPLCPAPRASALFCCLYACVLTDLNESERLYLSAAKILAGSGGLQDTEGDAGETGESIRRHGGVDAVAGYARLMAEYSARRGKAEVLFRRVLKVQPSHSSSLLGLAGLLMDTGNLHELIRAEKLIHQALLLNEMDSEAVAALATLTAKTTGDYDMAEGLYRKALELDPWHLPTMCNYGLLLQGVRRDYDKARAQYQAALAISPGYPPALSFMALMHHTVYDSPLQAHALYTQALARCPTHVPTLVNLGHLTWQALGHTSEVTLRAPRDALRAFVSCP